MNTHKTKVSALGVLTAMVVGAWLVLAAPAGAQPVALNGSVASGDNSFAANGSTASGDAVAIDRSTASGCSFAANVSTASGGVCPKPKAPPAPKKVEKVVVEKDKVVLKKVAVGEARPAVATQVTELAFTGPRVAPLVSTAAALLAAGAALVALASPRRKVAPTS